MNEKIRASAEKFRGALDAIDWAKDAPTIYEDFPAGTCRDMSELFAEHLLQEGFNNLFIVSGKNNDWSHAWIELENLAIDITADQFIEFDDIKSPPLKNGVLIAPPATWHFQFKDQKRQEFCNANENFSPTFEQMTIRNKVLELL